MDQKKQKAFREQLLAKKREILDAFNKNKNYGKEADLEGAQDIADKATSSYTKEFLFSLSNSERDLLQQVDEALSRIESGKFGICVACEDAIERKRLEAVPWARHCLTCQEKSEQGLL
ncbi:MAG: TraR/DksA family transcriptional regulator [Vicinamibacteria bacterium]|nr:TraR/DksA family transcriptional regulator [Vicinamibacteria bacterium]